MFQTNVVENIKTDILCSIMFYENRAVCETVDKIKFSRVGHSWQYGACLLRAVYLRLQIQAQNMHYILLFHGNNGYTKMSEYGVTRKFPVLLTSIFVIIS